MTTKADTMTSAFLTGTLAGDLELSLDSHFIVTTTREGWAEVRLSPAHALHGVNKAGRAVDARGAELDFIRVCATADGSEADIFEMTAKGACEGRALLSGSMTRFIGSVVAGMTETMF